MRTRATVLTVTAVTYVAACIVGNSATEPHQADFTSVYVAATRVDIGDEIDSRNVRLVNGPRDEVPDGAISRIADLNDRFARQRLLRGEPIMAAQLIESNPRRALVQLPFSRRCYSTRVCNSPNDVPSIGPGDHVDVVVWLGEGGNYPPGPKTILRDIRVLSVSGQQDEKSLTVMLFVTPMQALKLELASELGNLRLLLRRTADELNEATSVEIVLEGIDEDSTGASINELGPSLRDLLQK